MIIDVLVNVEYTKRVQCVHELKFGWESGSTSKNGKKVHSLNYRIYVDNGHKARPILVVLGLSYPQAVVRVQFCECPMEVTDECTGIRFSLHLK